MHNEFYCTVRIWKCFKLRLTLLAVAIDVFLRNGTIPHPSNSRKRATFAASTHVSLVETPTHYRQSTRKTIPHHPRQYDYSRRLRFRIKPTKLENIDDLAEQKTADDHDSCSPRKHARATPKTAVDLVASHAHTSSQ